MLSHPTWAAPGEVFHIPSLDGLRAVAVLIVFCSHVGLVGRMPGGLGVTIFFFLSGFLITTLLRLELDRTGTVSLRHFYLRRVLRLFPPMYLALLFAVGCTYFIGETFSPATLLIQALHGANYQIAFGGGGQPVGTYVLWSLSVEEHFYLLFPWLYLWLRRRVSDPGRQASWLLAICVAVFLWRSLVVLGFHAADDYTMHASDTRIDSILYGCAFACWRNPALPGPHLPGRWEWPALGVGVVVIILSAFSRDLVVRETIRYSLQGLALMPVFVAAVRFPLVLPFRLLNTEPMRWLGILSYPFYLFHLPVIQVLRSSTGQLGELGLAVVSFGVTLAISVVVYLAVEKPCGRLRRRLSHVSAAAQA